MKESHRRKSCGVLGVIFPENVWLGFMSKTICLALDTDYETSNLRFAAPTKATSPVPSSIMLDGSGVGYEVPEADVTVKLVNGLPFESRTEKPVKLEVSA
jgi:hypothetical protein